MSVVQSVMSDYPSLPSESVSCPWKAAANKMFYNSQENPSEEDGAVVDKIMSSRIVKKEVSILTDCLFVI